MCSFCVSILPICPRWVCFLRSQSDSQFFCPVNEICIIEGSTSIVYNRLRNSRRMYPFIYGCNISLNSSVCNWVYHQDTKKASKTNRQGRFWLLGGCRGPLWSMWIVQNGYFEFAILPMELRSRAWVSVCYSGMWGSQQNVHISNQTYQASSRIVLHCYRF